MRWMHQSPWRRCPWRLFWLQPPLARPPRPAPQSACCSTACSASQAMVLHTASRSQRQAAHMSKDGGDRPQIRCAAHWCWCKAPGGSGRQRTWKGRDGRKRQHRETYRRNTCAAAPHCGPPAQRPPSASFLQTLPWRLPCPDSSEPNVYFR